MLTDKQTNTQTDSTENNTSLAARVVMMKQRIAEVIEAGSCVLTYKIRCGLASPSYYRTCLLPIYAICRPDVLSGIQHVGLPSVWNSLP